jgi:predicted dehydrogenase
MRSPTGRNRRTFLMHSTGALTGLAALPLATNAFAGGADTIKVGLVGCGGRGTGAAEQALTADEGTQLVAMADVFREQLEHSHSQLKGSAVAARVEVPDDHRFVGFDAYKQLIDMVDVVLLATPPGFRPIHFTYAVEKGKHAFVEKPMAVDGPGLRAYMAAARKSKEKGLSAVNGFCWRYHIPRRETMQRVFDGQIGDIVSIEATYNSQGVWDPRRTREQCKSDMEYQLWNWYYYDWLSGDHIVEQAVHGIDTIAWATKGQLPAQCWGVGGRQARTDAKYGNIWDHFSVVYEYPQNVRAYHHCRHWPNTPTQVKDYIFGTKGMADVFGNRISGTEKWRFRGGNDEKYNMYQTEHNEMYQALRSGKPINNAEDAAISTLLAIMGRAACYTGETVTPDQILNSQKALVPDTFAWGDAPQRPIPVPGVTKLT